MRKKSSESKGNTYDHEAELNKIKNAYMSIAPVGKTNSNSVV